MCERLLYEFNETHWTEVGTGFELKVDHNFGCIPQVSVLFADGTETEVENKRDEKSVILFSIKRFKGKALLT
ncbi:MAG: hypothetical protein R3E79_51475 [Caldilineaceae bacterium]